MSVNANVVVLPQQKAPLRIETIRLPDPGQHQVLVKLFASGVCHSQLHQMHRDREHPVVLGHEATGVVMETGKDVTHVQEGDHVFVTWVPRDIHASGRLPIIATLETSEGLAMAENVYTWADHTVADEQYVVKVDKNVRTDVTAIIGCAVMTGAGAVLNTADVKKGESVAIFGAGGVGLSAVVAARMRGADPIIVVDLDDTKLEFAKRFGATHGINASREDAVAAIHALTAKEKIYTIFQQPVTGADYTFDCIGLKKTMEQVVPACRGGHFGAAIGGTAVLVGVPMTPMELQALDLLLHEKRFVGSIGGSCVPDRDFPTFVDWFEKGELDLDALVTERYKLEDINEATDALEAGRISGRAILDYRS